MHVVNMHNALSMNGMGDTFATISGIRFGTMGRSHAVNGQNEAQLTAV